MSNREAIVKMERIEPKRKILGIRFKGNRIQDLPKDMHVYEAVSHVDGTRELRRVFKDAATEKLLFADGGELYYVRLGEYGFSPVFSKIMTDDEGKAWDLQINGRMSVSDSRRILASFAMGLTSPNAPMTPAIAESWIADHIGPQVRNAIDEYGLTDRDVRDALPLSWWEDRISEWVGDCGVTVRVHKALWSSAEAEAAEAEAARQRDLERLSQARQREREAQIREAAGKAEYEKEKMRIEADMALSEKERDHQLQLLERRHRKELIEADAEIANAHREAEKAAREHELTMARLRQDKEALLQAEARGKEAKDRHEAVLKEIDAMKSTLAEIADLPDNLLAQLADRDERKSNAAAERLVSKEFGVPASTLAALGFRVERQNLVEALRQKSVSDGDKVRIQKNELVTRNMGTVRVSGLPINTSLQFEVTSSRSGYATVINIGTSGSVYLHVPNAYVTLEQAHITDARPYLIPGPELLPWERLRQLGLDYVEVGPPGWEHIAVVVSYQPTMHPRLLARASPEAPFVKLGDGDIADLCETLNDLSADQWTAGVLSFLVA